MAREILLIVDVQNDFCAGGALEVPDGDAVVPLINRLAGQFEHVVATQDWHTEAHSSFASSHPGRNPFETIEAPYGEQVLWPDHCVKGSKGAELHPDLDPKPVEAIVRKGYRKEIDSYSAFFENDHRTPTGLGSYLKERGIETVYLAGLALDVCVAFSALDARKLGFATIVIEDACRAIDLDGSLEGARKQMGEAGVKLVQSKEILSRAA